MYEHPYFTEKVAEFETERLERAAERRRFLAEHAGQIVPRAPGAVRQFGQRMLRAITGHQASAPDAVADAAPDAGADAVTAAPLITTPAAPRAARVAAPAEMATAAPVDRCVAVGCEPMPAR
ncbi:hypothetical protein [Microbacterium sp. K2]|uniref:hypothetical protein n=1 Tax=Microbacterium sp. K2 TaxID=3391827 RepID=UPI003EDA2513